MIGVKFINRLLIDDEYTYPDEVLKTDIFFDKLRPKEDRLG